MVRRFFVPHPASASPLVERAFSFIQSEAQKEYDQHARQCSRSVPTHHGVVVQRT